MEQVTGSKGLLLVGRGRVSLERRIMDVKGGGGGRGGQKIQGKGKRLSLSVRCRCRSLIGS